MARMTTTVAVVVLAGILLLWAMITGGLLSLDRNDPAGRGLAEVYMVVGAIVMWVLFGVVLWLTSGGAPRWTAIASVVLVPAGCAATLAAISLVADRAGRWPIVVPAVAPVLLAGFVAWTVVPALRSAVGGEALARGVFGALAVLAVIQWPAVMAGRRAAAIRRTEVEAEYRVQQAAEDSARLAELEGRLARLGASSRLWEWLDLAYPPNQVSERALAGARGAATRQADAEEMVARGFTYPLVVAGVIDLAPTPALCAAASALLRKSGKELEPADRSNPLAFSIVAARAAYYLPAVEWLARRCGAPEVVAAFDGSARGYLDSPDRAMFLGALAALEPNGKR